MRTRSYTYYGISGSCLYPLVITLLIAARNVIGGAKGEQILQENLLLDLSLLACFAISFIAPPILLGIGLFRSDVELSKAAKPFVWSLLLQALGSVILLIYVRGLARPPLLSLLFYLLLYSAMILIWRRRRLRKVAPPEPYRLKL